MNWQIVKDKDGSPVLTWKESFIDLEKRLTEVKEGGVK